MRPKARQAKIAKARERLRAANDALSDFFWMDPIPPETSWILQATTLLDLADKALVYADIMADGCKRPPADAAPGAPDD